MRMHRRNSHQTHKNHVHRWTVSYADYMTLMFALFVVLYAVSLSKEDKYQEVIAAIQSATQFVHSETPSSDGKGILTKRSNDIKDNTGPALLSDGDNHELGHVSELPSEELSSIQQFHTGEPLAGLQLSLKSVLESELESGAFSVDLNGDWLTIEMEGALLFAAQSHTLLNAPKKKIERIAEVLVTANNMIRLRGYTDMNNVSDEIYKSNWELSAMRAISVLHALNDKGIAGERMVVEGFGKFQPVLDLNGQVNKLKSRRVVIAISKFALFTDKTFGSDNIKATDKEQKNIQRTPKPDSEEIREIYLPDGRLIITTRQE